MTEREREFFDRKLESTSGEAHDKVVSVIAKRFIKEYIEKKEKEERNAYYIETNFGV